MTSLDPAASSFIERFAVIAEEDGHPRIAGRIAALLILRQEAVPFDELVSSLKISRGSVSTNTRLLEERGIIRRVSRLGERRDLFEIGPDSHMRVFEVALRRQQRLRDLAAETRRQLPPSERKARSALKDIEDFFSIISRSARKSLAQWSKKR
jgi:DNA-binding transcriptional regulator GbsR (MarR family)